MSKQALLGVLFVISSGWTSFPRSICVAQDRPTAQEADFRVATDIFFGTQKAPVQQTLTLYSAGVAYDISVDDPNQITMVDPVRNRIILLNSQQKTQATINLEELHVFIESARKQAETSDLATYLKGAEKIHVADNTVSVGDEVLQYRSTMQRPRTERMAEQYAQVADALMLLNGWRSGMPPFARLSLNRVIAEQKSLPEEITRTTGSGNQTEVRCRLHANWRLSKNDQQQIADIGTMLVTYQLIAAPQFFAAQAKIAASVVK